MYQIGAFSKICQVSVKTLRHYDRIGLLKPAEVDRFTGYRYYDRSQLERMLLIQRLKRYGFSLDEVQAILRGEDENDFHDALLRQRDRLRWQQQELGMTIHDLTLYLQQLERTSDCMEMTNQYQIEPRETERRTVLSCRQRMSVDDFGRYYGELFERSAREHFTPTGVTGAMYHDKEFDRSSSDIELFIGVREEQGAATVMEPQLCAATVHKGSYSSLPEAYAALVKWIEENGYVWDGAPYEIYAKAIWSGCAVEDWETEVYFPIRKK